jgi:FkbM family methyltransferase
MSRTDTRPASARAKVNELDLMLAVAEEFGETGLFVDVGASVGSFSEAFAKLGWDVIAVEAAPEIHAELVGRLAPFEKVEVVHAAASETGGEDVEFFLSSEFWGIHSLQPFHETHDEKVTVTSVRVADLLQGRPRSGPVVLKVDTEGADFQVLRGVDWDAHKPRYVQCEFMDERTAPHFGYVYADIIGFMAERGYLAYISEWAPFDEPSRRGVGGGPFTHLQIVRAPVAHQPSWGNLIFVTPPDEALFERVLNEYLIETRRFHDEVVAQAAKSVDRLARLEQSIVNRESTIDGLKSAVSQKDSRIAVLDSAVSQRESRITMLDTTIKEKNARIARLRSAIAQKNERIHSLKAAMQRRRTRYRWIAGALATLAVGLGIIALIK